MIEIPKLLLLQFERFEVVEEEEDIRGMSLAAAVQLQLADLDGRPKIRRSMVKVKASLVCM